jgi:sulfite exporter TauE/SafE
MTPEAASSYAQVLSLGVVWVSVHCAGMCGPLLNGLDVAGACRGVSPARGAGNVLLYQAGRALTYAALGVVAGLAGAGVRAALQTGGSVLALLGAALLLGLALRKLSPPAAGDLVQIGGRPQTPFLEQALTRLARALLPETGSLPLRSASLGVIMGLLPCMLTTWVLSLAAVTGSPLHGAGVMLTLVALTTPVLLGVTLLPRLLSARLRRVGGRVATLLLLVSSLWLTLVGLAGLGVIGHATLGLDVLGRRYALMLW